MSYGDLRRVTCVTRSIVDMLPILRCPETKGSLALQGDWLVGAHYRYPVLGGRPVLIRNIRPFHLAAPSAQVISQNIDSYYPPDSLPSEGLCLHLGSGNVPSADPRVISMDVLPNTNVDLVAEAEALPFVDGVFDLVVSGAVFEHLRDPVKAVQEARRVLKAGGRLVVDTAFMQGYHGFPSHYFNLTPQAVEAVLCDDFVLEGSQVPASAGPSKAIHTQVERYLDFLPPALRADVRAGSVSEFLDHLSCRDDCPDRHMTEYARRALAASFVVVARKPDRYDELSRTDHSSTTVRAEFYAARMAVIHRHHEVSHFAAMGTPSTRGDIPELEPNWLDATLKRSLVSNPMNLDDFRFATRALNDCADSLVGVRDRVLRSLAEQCQVPDVPQETIRPPARKGLKRQAQRLRRWVNRRLLARVGTARL